MRLKKYQLLLLLMLCASLVNCSPHIQSKIKLPNRQQPKPVQARICVVCLDEFCTKTTTEPEVCVVGVDLQNVLDNRVSLDGYATELEKLGCFHK